MVIVGQSANPGMLSTDVEQSSTDSSAVHDDYRLTSVMRTACMTDINTSSPVCGLVEESFYRASICEGGIGSRHSVCLSVRLSVCHTRGL